jgi:thioesterase domain-containing protein
VLYAAAANYLPRPYDSPVLLVRGERSVFGFGNDPTLGWGDLLGKHLEIRRTAGNHYTLYVEPNVEGLVQQLATSLKKSEEGWRKKQQPHTDIRQIA